MRAVFNDVISASETSHTAVIRYLTMLVVITVACNPSFCTNSNDATKTTDGSDNQQQVRLIHTSLIYLCDSTAYEFCQISTIASWDLDQFHEIFEYSFKTSVCANPNSSCSFENVTTENNSPSHNDLHIIQAKISDNLSLRIHVSFHNVSGGVYTLMKDINSLLEVYSCHVLICIGDDVTVQTAAIVADASEIPIIGYVTEKANPPMNTQGTTYTSLNPGTEAQGMVLAQIIGTFNMKQSAVIIQNTKMADGFLQGLRKVTGNRHYDAFYVMTVNDSISDKSLADKLVDLSTKGLKLMVVHTEPSMMIRIVNSALPTRLYNPGHAWFLSEDTHMHHNATSSILPEGLLAIHSFWLGGISDVMLTALNNVVTAFALMFRDDVDTDATSQFVPFPTYVSNTTLNDSDDNTTDNNDYNNNNNNNNNNNYANNNNENNKFLSHDTFQSAEFIFNWTSNDDYQKYFLRDLRASVYCSSFFFFDHGDPPCDDDLLVYYINKTRHAHLSQNKSSDVTNNQQRGRLWDGNVTTGSNTGRFAVTGPAYILWNTVRDDENRELKWSRVGYITINGQHELRGVLWPGDSLFGPETNAVKTYRVVTRPAEPFVYITQKVNAEADCLLKLVCLQVSNSSKNFLTKVVNDFQTVGKYKGSLYTMHCCEGIALELMKTLSENLNFRFVVYFVNDTDYGTFANGRWTGMIGDVVNGAADMIVGAFSITAQRMDVIHFTEPFFNNEYAQAVGQAGNDVSIWAFTNPFAGQVWMCIFMSSIVAGIATSFLEWHSPFGLNPKGRKRTKNYSLGSGLLMVMVLITGHTINIKAPKSWPGKLIQNVWAGLAIFIMTSYTANLAAYLAGQSAVSPAISIFNPELLTKKMAVMPSSAVETFLNKINPALGNNAKDFYVQTTQEAIQLLKDGKIDVYFDDMSLLEYALVEYDSECKVHIAGKGIGSDGYAIGLAKQSWWLEIPMSNMISLFTESGHVHDLAKKYISRPQCSDYVVGTATPYGLEHTGGLFLILLSSVFMSILLLICEHLIYYFAVPWMRRKPPNSFWKTESLAFISQRVYRVVRSERLYSQKKAAQEMIKIVKQRDFTRLIQKNELQKRKNPVQRKVKTKAEVFQEITANIVSYHRQLQSASEDADTVASSENADIMHTTNLDSVDIDTSEIPTLVGVNNTGYTDDSAGLPMDTYSRPYLSDFEAGSRETAFTYDNPGDFSEEYNEVQFEPETYLPRKMSSRSWAFTPREVPDTSDLQRRSTFRRPLRFPRKKKVSPPLIASHPHNRQSPSSPLNQSIFCDTHQQPHQPSHQANSQVFHCLDSDNDLDSSLPPPVHSLSSLCLSSVSANSSSFFPSPPPSLMQSPFDDDRRSFSTPHRTTDTNVSELSEYSLQNDEAARLPNHSPLPEIPLDPVVLDKTHRARYENDFSLNNSYLSGDGHSEMLPMFEDDKMPSDQNHSNRVYNHHGIENDSEVTESPTHQTSPPPTSGENQRVFSIEDNQHTQLNKNMRKHSDISDYRSPDNNLAVVKPGERRKTYDKQSRDYFKRNIKLKDNRVKSTLRHHAMSGYQNTLPADFIDECTLEALSKEDLLVLWKKSEIELEGRLNEVLDRNRRLGSAIQYLSHNEKEKQERLSQV